MSDPDDARAWIAKAEDDYALAISSLRRKKPITSGACFHAQQCAEKYLKALLIARQQTFPKTHDLILLDERCQQAGVLLGISPKVLNTLSDYAVRSRYPGNEPTVEEARDALATARAVRRVARSLLAGH